MKLLVGLGNPGREYEQTRHNVGFMVIDELAKRWNLSYNQTKFNGLFSSHMVGTEKVILCKPLTYMNLSGECVRPLMDYFKMDIDDLLVIYDDLDLPVGKIRLRVKGSAGGHNGIKSLIHHLGTDQFKRIRIGIGRPQNGQKVTDYVLGRFISEEQPDIQHAIMRAADACEKFMTEPFLQVMNEFNA
ncbi:aminoacyl-tRNA hydrolase [Anoxybacillus rupiensis]|uniref:Peptidyl-tRNA hydrolase n=1 Tax=Anoxybacteroides rupiense TaxID=311460 RepID=A0ABD5IY02_9BACL|nr:MULTISPECIES: aminoacyl-tRNA hydrolase [Anoxybacillus]KXG08264.1 Peptidyl-tRNA hydrolase [Anoxybacillus sp. P3H1B]MBB3909156.1 PTH1 family peptidyl-tRNA hydrolase [Anoxybacillus rupiensis]MBS2772700.1 aminoacyl-tRNA hydrolase [Anoxybacillus rupiensis]MDE8565398.1 aminoacyl-tRNA hydrolase [Anoxybacillus rupiensis]MED5052630.1 aminoacyl-tRNA hydrolase [Anoxybacillus rupiensis]